MAGQAGLFDLQDHNAELSKSGDPLERLLSVVDFEVFRPTLDAALGRKDRSRGGRPPLDAVMMFKILVLQALYGLSDEQAEYQVRDRLSFMRFLGLGLGDRVPNRTTIWLFREALVTAGAMEGLFARFDADLKERGYFALGGQIVDASIVEAPRQRLTRKEKRQIRDGEDLPWPPAKARQKDTQARWTVKRGRVKVKPGPTLDGSEARMVEGLLIPAFGYKSHINIDRRFRLIRRFLVTDAARHDGAQLPGLLNPDAFDSRVWADSAYRSKANEAAIAAAGPQHGAFPQAQGAADAGAAPTRQPRPLGGAIRRRACLRRPEAAHGAVHPHHRPWARHGEDRHRQPRLQFPTPDLARGSNCARIAPKPLHISTFPAKIRTSPPEKPWFPTGVTLAEASTGPQSRFIKVVLWQLGRWHQEQWECRRRRGSCAYFEDCSYGRFAYNARIIMIMLENPGQPRNRNLLLLDNRVLRNNQGNHSIGIAY
ncbi:Transposase DDE domain-containing protein [Azospirillum oryzae]|uniref:Transposase DDE domain-containing protein n=1 Tax=Azospirillum oryzae TaxID=286727 RepID=A0A1X7EZJ0_9PROT|nr:Transposase DDE domain-containing protein [Azospirillum oryzae]